MLRYISLAERLSAHVRLCNNTIILYRRHSGRVPLPRGAQFRFFKRQQSRVCQELNLTKIQRSLLGHVLVSQQLITPLSNI